MLNNFDLQIGWIESLFSVETTKLNTPKWKCFIRWKPSRFCADLTFASNKLQCNDLPLSDETLYLILLIVLLIYGENNSNGKMILIDMI